MQYPEPIAKLIDSYMKLPGIGEKTATRLAFYTLGMDQKDVEDFAKALLSVKKDLHYCSICGFITEDDPCPICRDKSRDRSTILVVEHSQDIMAMER
ncbi:recombination protein RecR, partial [[Eubacterium] rectale]|nr:recombination protein RecR [Agathobacter rectalis]